MKIRYQTLLSISQSVILITFQCTNIILSYIISNYTKSDWQWYRLKDKEKESQKEKATDWKSERKKERKKEKQKFIRNMYMQEIQK